MTQATQFADFMQQIWDTPITSTNDSVHIDCHPYYDYWHNAMKTAESRGAFKRWANKVAGVPGATLEFNDGSRINIATDGSAFILPNRRYNLERKCPK